MKVSKKQIAKWQKQDMNKHNGHAVNALEFDYIEQGRKLDEATRKIQREFDRRMKQEAAMEKIKNNPDLLKVMKRLKDR